jgi:hypothetical protein
MHNFQMHSTRLHETRLFLGWRGPSARVRDEHIIGEHLFTCQENKSGHFP